MCCFKHTLGTFCDYILITKFPLISGYFLPFFYFFLPPSRMILALGSASFHVNGAFNRKALKATNPVTPILQPKQLYPHFHPPWKKTRDASSSLKITLETSVSGPGCIKLLKVTGDFSQLLSALQSVMVFQCSLLHFFPIHSQ